MLAASRFMRMTLLLFGLLLCASGCRSPQTQHTAPAAEIIVYCNHCGVLAGRITDCPKFPGHVFQSAAKSTKVVCSHCGATPAGKPTVCPRFPGHEFQVFSQ